MDGATSVPIVPSFASTPLSFAPFCTRWIPSSARLLAVGCHQNGSSTTGGLHVYKLAMQEDAGQLQLVVDATKQKKAGVGRAGLKCGTCNLSKSDTRQLAVGDFEGRITVLDIERLGSAETSPTTFTIDGGHDQIVNAIDAVPNLILSGGRDGRACVWDVRQPASKGPVAELAFAESDCWAVAFANRNGNSGASTPEAFFAVDDGTVYLADLRQHTRPRWQHRLVRSSGICSLACHDAKLLATTVDDHLTLFDLDLDAAGQPANRPVLRRESRVEPTLRPPEARDATMWDARFSPHNRAYFMSAGGNGYLDLYKADGGAVRSVASVAAVNQPLLSFDWHSGKEGLFAWISLEKTLHVGFVPTPLR